MRAFRIILPILLFIILAGAYFFTKHESRHFLIDKVLHVKEIPPKSEIKSFSYFGLTGSRLEYYISVKKNDLMQLLSGRSYHLSENAQDHFNSWEKKQTHPKFSPKLCYTSNELSNGLVNVFVNKEESEIYIIYEDN